MSPFPYPFRDNRMPISAHRDDQASRIPSMSLAFGGMDQTRLGQRTRGSHSAPSFFQQLTFSGPKGTASGLGLHLGRSMNSSSSNTVMDFWTSSDDAPWNPVKGVTDSSRTDETRSGSFPNGLQHRPYRMPYGPYRDGTVLSDCESNVIPPSDSGYASGTRLSIGNPSIPGDLDRGHETQSVNEDLAQFSFQDAGSHLSHIGERDRHHSLYNAPGGPQYSLIPSTGDTSLWCHECAKQLKTKSEKKKHIARHTKPFCCTVSGCDRSREGFSTRNDLDRHKKSKHPNGDEGYKCHHGTCNAKKKLWPRPDNFKTHLKKVHNVDVEQVILEDYLITSRNANHMSDNLAGLGTSMVYPMVPEDRPGSVVLPPGYLDMDHTEHPPNSSIVDSEDPLRGQHFDPRDGQVLSPQFDFSLSPEDSEHRERPQAPSFIQTDRAPSEVGEPCDLPQAGDDRLREESSPLPQNGQEASDTSSFMDSAAPDVPPEMTERLNSDALCQDDQQSGQIGASSDDHEETTTTFAIAPDNNHIHNVSSSVPDEAMISSNSTDSEGPTGALQAKQPQAQCSQVEDPSEDPTSVQCSKKEGLLTELDADTLLRKLQSVKGQVLDQVLKTLGYERPKPLPEQSAPAVLPTRDGSSSSDTMCPIPGCGRNFSRPSELKKHMKRHSKPYGCTFPQCPKKFGSKNDWKRHETSQHVQREAWRCNQPLEHDASVCCGKVYYSRDSAKEHLREVHPMDDAAAVDERLEKCRFGNGCEDRFWCGFCQELVEIALKHSGGGALSKRYDHIDDHIWGRNNSVRKDMSEWVDVDQQQEGSNEKGISGSNQRNVGPDESNDRDLPHANKRRPSSDALVAAAQKKRKQARQEIFWCCCSCRDPVLWNWDTTLSCITPGCGHERCAGCKKEFHDPP